MILMYHKVAPQALTTWWVTADTFNQQMASLQAYEVVSLEAYDPANPKHAVITFDGVYENVYQFAFPILKKWGYPFELFVTGNVIGATNEFDNPEPLARFCTVEQLQKMTDCGGRLQWHTASHRRLDKNLNSQEIATELDVPETLRTQFPSPHFDWFAYPHGDHNQEIVSAVYSRFKGAVSCIAGNDHDKYQLNRLTITESTCLKSTTVSIIIANYNYGNYLPEAVDSVLTQTLPPDEIILIDDASTDSSPSIAKRYADQVRVVLNESNLGIVGCFNKAVSMASGDYIAILGADNRMRADYVERCKSALDREPNVAVAYTDMTIFGSRSSILASAVGATEIGTSIAERWPVFHWKFPEPTPEVLGKLDKENFIHGSSMYRRGVFVNVGGYMDGNGPEDHNLFKRMIAAGWEVFHVPHALIEYRQHSTSQANTVLNLQIELAHLRTQAVMINQAVANRDQRISELTQQLANRDQQIVDIFSSYSWKLTAPLRKVKQESVLLMPKLKHYVKVNIGIAKRIYYRLPVNWQQKIKSLVKNSLPSKK